MAAGCAVTQTYRDAEHVELTARGEWMYRYGTWAYLPRVERAHLDDFDAYWDEWYSASSLWCIERWGVW